jgi:Spx/MgsR family transcriptional regulator
MTTLFGIRNCDTVRRARAWLAGHSVEYRFHDFRLDGLDSETLSRWVDTVGFERLVHRRGTSWRKLPQPARENLTEGTAMALMLDNPTLIRRPVLETDARLLVGFQEREYASLIQPNREG